MREILKKIQVHVPFYRLRENLLPMVIREGIHPEISFNHRDLDRFQVDDLRRRRTGSSIRGYPSLFMLPSCSCVPARSIREFGR